MGNAESAPPPSQPPSVNDATINYIKDIEKFVAEPKPDPVGYPTVGYGHKCQQPKCAEVPYSFPLTRETAEALLHDDLRRYASCVSDSVSPSVSLNDNQRGALTSFTYNVGCGALKSSTMLRRINAGEDPNTVAAEEMPRFHWAGGKVSNGLARRRAEEVELFQSPCDD